MEEGKCPYWKLVHPANGARYHGRFCTTMYGCTKPSDCEHSVPWGGGCRYRGYPPEDET